MLKIETLIKDTSIDARNKTIFLSIDHPNSVNLVNQTLEENENDYLEGAIRLEYNSELILSESMETTDLLFTWQTLVEPLITPKKEEYEIVLLDSLYEIKLSTVKSGYTFLVNNIFDMNQFISNPIPENEYTIAIQEGLIKFGDFIVNKQFSFSHESSYSSFISDYQKLKSVQKE